jgi:hypothetical protein
MEVHGTAMNKKLLITALFGITFLASAGEGVDSARVHGYFLGINPLSLVFGGLSMNLERVTGRHGLFVEGNYTSPLFGSEGYEGCLAYRFHFRASDRGGFFGPFVRTGYMASKIRDESRTDYRYSLHYTTFGMTVGKRKYLWARHGWLYTWRLGIGYPLRSSFSWDTQPPEKINGVSTGFLEAVVKASSWLDGELSISFPL